MDTEARREQSLNAGWVINRRIDEINECAAGSRLFRSWRHLLAAPTNIHDQVCRDIVFILSFERSLQRKTVEVTSATVFDAHKTLQALKTKGFELFNALKMDTFNPYSPIDTIRHILPAWRAAYCLQVSACRGEPWCVFSNSTTLSNSTTFCITPTTIHSTAIVRAVHESLPVIPQKEQASKGQDVRASGHTKHLLFNS